MEIINKTPFIVEANQATDKHGRCYLVALVKATYRFPEQNNQTAVLAEQQTPVYDADVFEAEPGLSTTYFESDWCLRKQRCDVIVKASAYAPTGTKVKALGVKIKIAQCEKKLKVVGPRTWRKNVLGVLSLSSPQSFSSMPITYSRTYGGNWPARDEYDKPAIYAPNPVGCGFAKRRHKHQLENTFGPSIGPINNPFEHHSREFTPMSFGPIGRQWPARARYAGTYDKHWQDNVFPLWPQDFDECFFQSAPEDQQIPYPTGGETISLWHLHPERRHIHFNLPFSLELPMVAITPKREQTALQAQVDTLTVDADALTVSLVWRAQLPIKRSLREIKHLAVGEVYEELFNELLYESGGGCGDCGL